MYEHRKGKAKLLNFESGELVAIVPYDLHFVKGFGGDLSVYKGALHGYLMLPDMVNPSKFKLGPYNLKINGKMIDIFIPSQSAEDEREFYFDVF